MKVFLDTNVILDWILDRPNFFAAEATSIIEAGELGKIEIFVSSGSIYTLAYIIQKTNKTNSNQIIEAILKIIKVLPIENATFQKALKLGITDIEDAFQYQIASENTDIKYFITGNLKDFSKVKNQMPKVISPLDFIKTKPSYFEL